MSLLCVLCEELSAKVRLLTFHYDKPDFIEIQYKTFNKFLLDDFELIVFNDADNPTDERAIQEVCNQHGIKCIRFEPEWHLTDPLNDYLKMHLDNPAIGNHVAFPRPASIQGISQHPSVRRCHVIQYALDHYGYYHDDVVAILDGGAFPIRPLSLREWLRPHDIISIQRPLPSENTDYLQVIFVAFHPQKLSNSHELKFHLDVINGQLHDSGSHSYHYLNNHPTLKVKKYLGLASSELRDRKRLQKLGFTKREIWLIKSLPRPQSVEFHMDKHFLYFGASSFNMEGPSIKAEYVHEFVNKLLIDSTTPIDNTVFVILRHVRDEDDDALWKRCYQSIRQFYTKTPIVIIDDNSKINLPWGDLENTLIIQSEYPGAGELLPYYYFLKYKWATKMIFLHDSMLLKRRFYNSELNHLVKFHWHFETHRHDDDNGIRMLLRPLTNSDELIYYNHQKSLWNGCAGVTSIIDISVLEHLESKYSLTSSLIKTIKTRTDRMSLERIFAILMFKEGYITKSNCSMFGNVFDYPRYGQQVDNGFLEHLRLTYHGAILKTWHGR
jgi:hypothetical protein